MMVLNGLFPKFPRTFVGKTPSSSIPGLGLGQVTGAKKGLSVSEIAGVGNCPEFLHYMYIYIYTNICIHYNIQLFIRFSNIYIYIIHT